MSASSEARAKLSASDLPACEARARLGASGFVVWRGLPWKGCRNQNKPGECSASTTLLVPCVDIVDHHLVGVEVLLDRSEELNQQRRKASPQCIIAPPSPPLSLG